MNYRGCKKCKMQGGGPIPKEKDYPNDYAGWQAAMDAWMGTMPNNPLINYQANVPYVDESNIERPFDDSPAPPVLNRMQEGIQKGMFEAPEGYTPQEYYDAVNTPYKKKRKSPYQTLQNIGLGMKAARFGLGWLSGAVERNRQNQSDYDQQSALAMTNPMPAQQPNPYSLYAKYGGNLKTIIRDYDKWTSEAQYDFGSGDNDIGLMEQGGLPQMKKGGYEIDRMFIMRKILPQILKMGKMGTSKYGHMQSGGQLPQYQKAGIVVNNPNDPRLRAYNDSSALYNNYINVKNNLKTEGYNEAFYPKLTNYEKNSTAALNSKKLFGTKSEWDGMYSVEDLVPWVINKKLGRQLISPTIKPNGTETFERRIPKNDNTRTHMLRWKREDNRSGGERFSDNGEYVPIDSREFANDLRVIANYSNVNPKEQVIYRDPVIKKNSKFVPLTPPEPQEPRFKRPISIPRDRPNMGNVAQPQVGAPDMERAQYDMSQPTNWNITSPTFDKNIQETTNFPDEATWRAAMENYRNVSSQQRDGKGTATGYRRMKRGGLTPNKAREILHDGTAQGKPLTDKQRRYFGAMSKGHTNYRGK